MRIEQEIKQENFKSQLHKANLNIMFTGGWLNARTNQVLKPFKLSPEQYNVLRILRGSHSGFANLCDIQQRMLDRMSNATRLVEKLRQKGLLTRELCPENRRKVDIRITPQGLALMNDIEGKLTEMYSQIKGRITEEEARQLNEILDRLRG
jgi:DNA-binding MarR family transcriptional regulator